MLWISLRKSFVARQPQASREAKSVAAHRFRGKNISESHIPSVAMCSFGTIETLRQQGSLTLLRSMGCDRMWHSMTRSVVDDDDFDYDDDMKPRSRGVHSISFVTAFVFRRREGMNE